MTENMHFPNEIVVSKSKREKKKACFSKILKGSEAQGS